MTGDERVTDALPSACEAAAPHADAERGLRDMSAGIPTAAPYAERLDDSDSAARRDESVPGHEPAQRDEPASAPPPNLAEAPTAEYASADDAAEEADDDGDFEIPDYQLEDVDVDPLESLVESEPADADIPMQWYILKVQVNRENSICEALQRRIKVAGLERYFGEILVPTEDVREFAKSGKQRIVKRKLYPGYIVVRMAVNDDTWFLVRETTGIGDFTGAAGKPAPLSPIEIERILNSTRPAESRDAEEHVKTAIRFKVGDRVRVKEGYFENYEGEVSNIDERNGRVTVMINIFGRPNPVELDHWQMETM